VLVIVNVLVVPVFNVQSKSSSVLFGVSVNVPDAPAAKVVVEPVPLALSVAVPALLGSVGPGLTFAVLANSIFPEPSVFLITKKYWDPSSVIDNICSPPPSAPLLCS